MSFLKRLFVGKKDQFGNKIGKSIFGGLLQKAANVASGGLLGNGEQLAISQQKAIDDANAKAMADAKAAGDATAQALAEQNAANAEALRKQLADSSASTNSQREINVDWKRGKASISDSKGSGLDNNTLLIGLLGLGAVMLLKK